MHPDEGSEKYLKSCVFNQLNLDTVSNFEVFENHEVNCLFCDACAERFNCARR